MLTAQELQFQAISALITEAARLYLERSEIDTAISLFNSLRTDRFTVASLSQLREALRLPPIDVNNLVSTLFECGVVGMFDEGPGGARRYTFKFRNRHAIPILSNTFVLHRGAHRAFGIDRARWNDERPGPGRGVS